MKRLISVLLLVAMMLASFSTVISAFADEIGAVQTVAETEKVYNVNWKELVEDGTMRAQWIYDRSASNSNMSSKYNITATENALLLSKIGGDHRSYYSEVMFDITADTQYEYVFKADKTSDNCADAGVVFAWAADSNAYIRNLNDFDDGVDDIYPGVPKGAYHIMANWGGKTDYKVHFGGSYDDYAVFGTNSSKAKLTDVAVDEENFATYKVVYIGLQVKMYYLDTANEWIEFFDNKTMILSGNVKLAVGLTTWSPSHTNLKDCVVTAKNEAAVAAMNAAFATDKTAFDSKLAEAEALAQIGWLDDDLEAFEKKIDAAKVQAQNAKYKYEVDYAMAKIDSAMSTLNVTATNIRPTLAAKITDVENILGYQILYTEASWAKMINALEIARTVYNDYYATQSDLANAYNALKGAKDGLLAKELVAKNTYNINWKYLYVNNLMRSQWWCDNSGVNNKYDSKYNVTATENYLGSEPIGDGDNLSYYSTVMFEITENTYYEYTFEAKNDRAGGYAGIMFAYDTNDFPYFVYGQFDNSSDNGASADFRYRKGHQDRYSDGHNSIISTDHHYPVLDLTADGYGQFKYVYDGYNFSFYAMTEGEMKLIWSYTLPEGSKVAPGVYTREGSLTYRRTMSLQNAVLVAYNEAAAEILVDTAVAKAIAVAEVEIANPDYTPVSVQRVKDAMAVVKSINAETPAADVDAAIAALESAITKLKADKDALIAKIDEVLAAIGENTAEAYEERYYTPFAAALATAIEVRDNLKADQAMVDEALAALENTYKYLTPAGQACVVDLDAVLAAYALLVETDYKPSSWATLAEPYNTAYDLYYDYDLTNADQEAIDAAVVALNGAIEALVKRADFIAIQAIYDRALTLNADDYKNWSSVGMDYAINNAASVICNLELDQYDVDAAYAALNTAMNALVTWRTNVLAIVPADDYVCNSYEYGDNPSWYNKITDMSYYGLGNVFYYDYHKVIADKIAEGVEGFEAGKVFPQSMKDMGIQGSGNYTIRLGTNVAGSASNRVTDGEKDATNHSGLSHRSSRTWINGKVYGHVFGFSFLKAPTVDSIAVYLPTDTKIVSIDVYGAVRETLADGTVLYGKADKADVVIDENGVQDESATTVKKVYLGTVVVPAADDGATNIYAAADFVQAMAVEYIYFAINFNESHGANEYYYMYEIELFGLEENENPADFTKINKAYAEFMNCVKSDYTEESWATVLKVFEDYKNVIGNCLASQSEVNTAAVMLDTAVKSLVAKDADWTYLNIMITAGSKIIEDEYTPNTYNPFKIAYDEALALRESTNVPQTKINQSVAKLTAAYEALVKRADKTALKAAYDDAKTLEEANYSDVIAWKMFEKKMEYVECILADDNAIQDDVDDELEALNERISRLVLIVPSLDKLRELVALAETLSSEDYTPDSFERMQNALDEANLILSSSDTLLQTVVTACENELESAIDSLTYTPLSAKRIELLALLGEKIDNSLDIYTSSSYNEYSNAYDSILSSINGATTYDQICTIDVQTLKDDAESKLRTHEQAFAEAKSAQLALLGVKIDNSSNIYTSASYSAYSTLFESILAQIEDASDIEILEAIDVATLKDAAESNLVTVAQELSDAKLAALSLLGSKIENDDNVYTLVSYAEYLTSFETIVSQINSAANIASLNTIDVLTLRSVAESKLITVAKELSDAKIAKRSALGAKIENSSNTYTSISYSEYSILFDLIATQIEYALDIVTLNAIDVPSLKASAEEKLITVEQELLDAKREALNVLGSKIENTENVYTTLSYSEYSLAFNTIVIQINGANDIEALHNIDIQSFKALAESKLITVAQELSDAKSAKLNMLGRRLENTDNVYTAISYSEYLISFEAIVTQINGASDIASLNEIDVLTLKSAAESKLITVAKELSDAKNAKLAELGEKIENTDGIYTVISYADYTIGYYGIVDKINSAINVSAVNAINVETLKVTAEAKLITVAKELYDAKSAKLTLLGEKIENSTNIYTVASYAEYVIAFDAIAAQINSASDISALNAIDVSSLKTSAEGRLITVAQELAEAKIAKLDLLGDKIENISNIYTSASYSAYVASFEAIVSQINSASNISSLNAIDVLSLKALAETKLVLSSQELTAVKNAKITALGAKIENTNSIYTTVSYAEYAIAYYEIVAQINNATDVASVNAINLVELKASAEAKLITVAADLVNAKSEKISALGAKIENVSNIYTAESYTEYVIAFEAIVSQINSASDISVLNAIDVSSLNESAKSKLVLVVADMAALVDAKNSAIADLGAKIENTDGIYTSSSYSEYTIAYYEVMAKINNATKAEDVKALDLNALKALAEAKLVLVAKELSDAKANKIASLGLKLENANTNIYTADSCAAYSDAFDAIIVQINQAQTLAELNAIDVNALKIAAEAKLVLVAKELSDAKLAALTALGAKIENVGGAYTSVSYAEYTVAYYEIVSKINNANDMAALSAIDVNSLKTSAEAKLAVFVPTTEDSSTDDSNESETKASETEKKTDKGEEKDDAVKESEKNQGCASAAGISALMVIGIIGTAVVLKKKEFN